jgi:hypothetical protein
VVEELNSWIDFHHQVIPLKEELLHGKTKDEIVFLIEELLEMLRKYDCMG